MGIDCLSTSLSDATWLLLCCQHGGLGDLPLLHRLRLQHHDALGHRRGLRGQHCELWSKSIVLMFFAVLALASRVFHPDGGLAQLALLLPAAPLPRHLHPHVQGRRLHHAQVPPHHVRLCHCFWLRLPHPVQEQQRKK